MIEIEAVAVVHVGVWVADLEQCPGGVPKRDDEPHLLQGLDRVGGDLAKVTLEQKVRLLGCENMAHGGQVIEQVSHPGKLPVQQAHTAVIQKVCLEWVVVTERKRRARALALDVDHFGQATAHVVRQRGAPVLGHLQSLLDVPVGRKRARDGGQRVDPLHRRRDTLDHRRHSKLVGGPLVAVDESRDHVPLGQGKEHDLWRDTCCRRSQDGIVLRPAIDAQMCRIRASYAQDKALAVDREQVIGVGPSPRLTLDRDVLCVLPRRDTGNYVLD
jgi:hypothetical protein